MKRKNKICIEFGRDDQPWFSKKRCQNCAQKSYKSLTSSSLKSKNIAKERDVCLDKYFNFHIERCNKSEETGFIISDPTKVNIAHLIDKGRHISLKCNLENYIYLTWQEHSQFDTLLMTHQFERLEKEFKNSWVIACKRYRKIIPLCEEQTNFLKKLKEYLCISH